MPELHSYMRLYHGSYTEVRLPDLSRCSRFKDFGRGFYLTSSEEQARSFARISARKAFENGVISSRGPGIVSAFLCVDPSALQVLEYPTADADWLHCVVGHRRRRTFPEWVRKLEGYDVVSGKIANDNTNATITAYMQGIFGEPGSEAADRVCIGLLLPERLQDQYCFRTGRALQTLTFEWSEIV